MTRRLVLLQLCDELESTSKPGDLLTLAVAAKLREAHSLISEAASISNIMSRLLLNMPPAFPIDAPFHDDISRLGGRIQAFSERIGAFAMIEVP